MSERETSMGRVLALDLATRCGWAANLPPGVDSGVERFLRPATRWVEFSDWLAERLDTLQPDRVVYEAGLIGSGRSAHTAAVAFGMSTRVEEQAARRGMLCESVHNATLKLWATGSGKATKDDMIRAAWRCWQTERRMVMLSDADEADALCLLGLALGRFPVPVVKKRKALSVLPRREPGAGG